MPFTKHIIEPINISQCPLPPGEPNELECISNLTLANVIRQLSSLGQHAGRIFDELVHDATKINNRSQLLSQRIDNLKQKVANLDIQNEEVTLEDCHNRKQFRNSVKIDQKVVSRKTMPEAMKLMYDNADPPPALDRLNPYRRDGKDCMKFYTDPEFFFNIWCNELIKDNEARKKEKKRRKTGEKQNLKSPQKNEQPEPSNLFVSTNPQFRLDVDPKQNLIQTQILKQQQQQQMIYQQHHFNGNFSEQSLPPPPQHILRPDSHMNNYEIYAESNQMNNGNRNNKLIVHQVRLSKSDRPGLPPPPIPDNSLSDLQQIQQQMMRKFDQAITHNHKLNELNSEFNGDLPPPPSPPNFTEQTNFSVSLNQRVTNLTISQKKIDNSDSVIDMPLPPPPIELQDTIELPPPISPPGSHKNNNPPLPPPPPLPPLVESDTTSSTSSLSATNISTTATTPKPQVDKPSAAPSFLDDINKKRFVLKPTKIDEEKKNGRNDSSREAIQSLVNNSDVAAIIDFVRKFRPHVRDSSDEEENSDWDE